MFSVEQGFSPACAGRDVCARNVGARHATGHPLNESRQARSLPSGRQRLVRSGSGEAVLRRRGRWLADDVENGFGDGRRRGGDRRDW